MEEKLSKNVAQRLLLAGSSEDARLCAGVVTGGAFGALCC